ncbi:terminase small subunit [Phyllobacterium sp. 628]|uniref:terminase small subunit n=1 Tax=Phyllobacterium sp. 628 TaxID=2718938 RepID=UPI0016625384|nr:terminase small subunit [Phyllobacterium sp. 628]QND53471.1 terminase small subunit [Phyllobacterium sp. 628]
MTDKLTPKQERFVDEYLIDLNATQAAIRAGYAANGAEVTGSKLLRNPKVMAAINARKDKRSEAVQVDAEYVLKRLHDENEADVADLFNKETGEVLPVHEWPLIFRKGLVQGIETEQLYEGHGKERKWIGTKYKVRLDSRIKRTELIGKHVRVNAFSEQVVVKGLDTLADRLERAMKRDG